MQDFPIFEGFIKEKFSSFSVYQSLYFSVIIHSLRREEEPEKRMMSNFPTEVDIVATYNVYWRIDRDYQLFDSSSTHQLHVKQLKYSNTFKLGYLEFKLCLCKSDSNSPLLIGIDQILNDDKGVLRSIKLDKCLINVVSSDGVHKTTRQQGGGGVAVESIHKHNVMWRMDDSFTGKFTVMVYFGNFWIRGANRNPQQESNKQCVLASLGRMLSENSYTDVTINTSDGVKIGVHRAILASRSPVFNSMFSHDFQEKGFSTINITDMSTKACQLFFKYIYGGNLEQEELVENRLELLGAADKYDIPELKETCIQSFSQDIDQENVIEILRTAAFYRLPKLKNICMRFLVKFGNIFEIQDEFKELLQTGDRDLIDEIFREVLKEWKSCIEGGMDID